ncbi:hypothetical protein BJX62DRAFT_220041 [Aspergillus germanicus]
MAGWLAASSLAPGWPLTRPIGVKKKKYHTSARFSFSLSTLNSLQADSRSATGSRGAIFSSWRFRVPVSLLSHDRTLRFNLRDKCRLTTHLPRVCSRTRHYFNVE